MISINTIELGYNIVKGTKYFVSLRTSVVLTEEYAVMVRGGINRCKISGAIAEVSHKSVSL
jgi:hypothetical protein